MPNEHDRFKKMVEQSQDWFWEFDEQANFTYVSPRIRDLLGYEPEELLGRNAFDLMDAAEAARVRKHFDPIADKHLPFNHLENTNRHKNGHEVVLESSGTPFFDEDGRFRGYRGIDRDITERKRIEQALGKSQAELRQALDEAGQAERALIEIDKMRSEFVSAAAHELSTPLAAIMGYAELLLTQQEHGRFTAAQQQEFLTEIHERGGALNRVIEDLLDISRIESGHHLALERQETDLADFLQRLCRYFGTHHAGHSFRLDFPGTPLQSSVPFDRRRIRQVIDNLISNAIKYSPKGSEIIMSAQEVGGAWEIGVEDQGIGMTPEQIERVFDKFYRADTSDTAVSGLGLGMSIARQIVETHGGSIRVASTLGKGTTVTFVLPRQAVQA